MTKAAPWITTTFVPEATTLTAFTLHHAAEDTQPVAERIAGWLVQQRYALEPPAGVPISSRVVPAMLDGASVLPVGGRGFLGIYPSGDTPDDATVQAMRRALADAGPDYDDTF